MSNEISLGLNITKKQIEDMAKSVIREMVGEQIKSIMDSLDIKTVIENKIKSVDGDITKQINNAVKKHIDDMKWKIDGTIDNITRKIVLEEIEKKPISDMKVYLKVQVDNDDNY
jgi:DNA-binding protein Fis